MLQALSEGQAPLPPHSIPPPHPTHAHSQATQATLEPRSVSPEVTYEGIRLFCALSSGLIGAAVFPETLFIDLHWEFSVCYA